MKTSAIDKAIAVLEGQKAGIELAAAYLNDIMNHRRVISARILEALGLTREVTIKESR
jgi:hypothetical protein